MKPHSLPAPDIANDETSGANLLQKTWTHDPIGTDLGWVDTGSAYSLTARTRTYEVTIQGVEEGDRTFLARRPDVVEAMWATSRALLSVYAGGLAKAETPKKILDVQVPTSLNKAGHLFADALTFAEAKGWSARSAQNAWDFERAGKKVRIVAGASHVKVGAEWRQITDIAVRRGERLFVPTDAFEFLR